MQSINGETDRNQKLKGGKESLHNQNPHQRIGGLHLTNGVTKVLFYHMVGILIRVTLPWSLRDESIENSRERRTRYWRVIILSSHEVSSPFYLLLFRREEVANR